MQERLATLDLYKTRNPKEKPLDSINHRINTLRYFMFGYEYKEGRDRNFIFSPLGNLFLKYINDNDKQTLIFAAMLFGIQFENPFNGTPAQFQIYPFRLIFKLLTDTRLGCKLYFKEYAYFLPFIEKINWHSYETLVEQILEFRKLPNDEVAEIMKEDEHTYVNCVYEWQYYVCTLLEQANILDKVNGDKIIKLFHPGNEGSKSARTGRTLNDGFVKIKARVFCFIQQLLKESPFDAVPVSLRETDKLKFDTIKEIYAYYPQSLLSELGEANGMSQLLDLAKLIETYSNNPNNETTGLFEEVLESGFNMFHNVEARRISGAGHTDIECLYLTVNKTFAVEAKSTGNKLLGVNAGRLKGHREEVGAKYTIVITPRYVPAVRQDYKRPRDCCIKSPHL